MLRIGHVIHGYCGGIWGNEALVYEERRVEALGVDWVVVRNDGGAVEFYVGDPDELLEYVSGE